MELRLGHLQLPDMHILKPNRENDKEWPEPDRVGKQELEIVLGDEHISFTVSLKRISSALLIW
jgi:hypothetical protein